jgi:hypothetical protein
MIIPVHYEHAATGRALRDAGKSVPSRKMDPTHRDGVHGMNYRYRKRPCEDNGGECGEETNELANFGSELIMVMMNIIGMYHFFYVPD